MKLPYWRLRRVTEYVDRSLDERISLATLAQAAGLSRMHFAALFRAATGMRPHDYVMQRRIQRAKELLAGTQTPIVDVALSVGFQTQAHFTTVFKRVVGFTPYRWRVLRSAEAIGA
jgi:AraC-like DNA-binding protein